ncbi:hypothetical protein [Thaumasiovibrio sp. DFM-14]|uniref:hypothetical protein n=1 Tax=Thaumasiovibrio sp. DFM-14 TaxID=3384792 RepID=UPI0039A104F9
MKISRRFLLISSMSLLIVGLYSLSLHYIMASSGKKMEAAALAAVRSLDKKIDQVVDEIYALPVDVNCAASKIDEYKGYAYRSTLIRATGIAMVSDIETYICSVYGQIYRPSEPPLWNVASRRDVHIGTSLNTDYFPETSFVVIKESGNVLRFAYVNPKYVLGHWIMPKLDFATYRFYLGRKRQPLYEKEQLSSPSGLMSKLMSKEIARQVKSSRFPFRVGVSLSYGYLTKAAFILLLKWVALALVSVLLLAVFFFSLRSLKAKSDQFDE